MRYPATYRLLATLLAVTLLLVSCSAAKKPKKDDLEGQAQSPPQSSLRFPKQEPAAPLPKPAPKADEQLAKAGTTVTRTFEPGGIRIRYITDNALNRYEGKPHTITFVVYQLTSPNEFMQVAKDTEGLTRLLRLERFGASVLGVNQYFAEPAETKILDIDRLENVKWVGIVAGYWNQIPGQTSRIYEMPVSIEKTGTYGFRKTEAAVLPLVLNLYLGPYSLQEVPEQ